MENEQTRVGGVRSRLQDLEGSLQGHVALLEIRDRLREVDDVLRTEGQLPQQDSLEILYHLDRCEELLRLLEDTPPGRETKQVPLDISLHPSVGEALITRVFAVLVRLRSRLLGYEDSLAFPTLREILYLKSPSWIEPVMRRVLPRGRMDDRLGRGNNRAT